MKTTGEGTSWWAQSVKKCVYSDYVHTDRLGSVVNLTDQYGRVPAQIDYDDWGKVTAYQSLNISGGYRTVLPEITYAGHQYDDVLGMYYAKARMYDAENRRFASVDPVKGRITEPMTLVQYLYVVDDPLRWVDLLGLRVDKAGGEGFVGSIPDAPALPWGTELVAQQGVQKLYESYSLRSPVLDTIPNGGSVFSQNEAKIYAGITWYKVSFGEKNGWVDANNFKVKTSAPAALPAPTPTLTPTPEITPPSGNKVVDQPQQSKSIWDKLITVGLGAGYGVAILVSFAAENAATISGWRSQLGHAIQDFELDPGGAVSAIENAAKGIPIIENIAASAIEGYQDFVHWGTDFGVESYDSISDFLNNAYDTVSGAKDSLGDAYQERVGCIEKAFVNDQVDCEYIRTHPDIFNGKTAYEIAGILNNMGYQTSVSPSTRSSSGAMIIQVKNSKTIQQIQVSPGGGRHGDSPYVKISTTNVGRIKIINGSRSTYQGNLDEEKAIVFFTKD